jgi:hypothetical protein
VKQCFDQYIDIYAYTYLTMYYHADFGHQEIEEEGEESYDP